ncbi:MAG: MBL fold metallo-hydrolase [Synergistaceae bacterium]|nr:MBL fold metallo-hydrolase [Synergistaceae bacterium]
MFYKVPVKGYFEVNSYFFVDEKASRCFLIDPGAEGRRLLKVARENYWVIEKILLTHGHFDHMGGIAEIRMTNDIPVYAYENADLYLLDPMKNLSRFCGRDIYVRDVHYLHDGDVISLNNQRDPEFSLKVIHTPGHTEDSVVFFSENEKTAFVGDTIFKGSIGSTMYPGGNDNGQGRTHTIQTISPQDLTPLTRAVFFLQARINLFKV